MITRDPALAIVDKLFQEKITQTTLENGLSVLLKQDTSADLVSVQLYVKTGSIHEGQYLGTGISHYVEHMLFKGTKGRSFSAISESIHASGGHANAYTSFDRTVYYIDTLAESLDLSLDILADMAFDSQFLEKECLKERDVIIREIDMYQDDPDQQLSEAVFTQAFRAHPYRFPIIGIKAGFLSLQQADLYSYYKERYVPNNMVLVLTGRFEEAQALEKIKHYFGQVPYKALAPYVVAQELPQLAKRTQRLYGPYNISRGQIAFKIPHLSHADSPALDILANILGQGQSSILWQKLREELKLVHEIDVHAWKPGQEGLLCISYTCENGKREAAERAILGALEDFKSTVVPQKLLDKTLRQALMGEINARKTISGQASRLGTLAVVVGDLQYPAIYLKKLSRLAPQDIQAVAQSYLCAERSTVVSLEAKETEAKTFPTLELSSSLPDFELHTLKNGVRVALQPIAGASKVSLRASLLGGVLYETDQTYGLTALVSTLFTKDTASRSALEVAQTLEALGISFSEFAGNNSFGLSLEALPDDLDLGIDIIQQALLHPKLSQEAFELERAHQISQIKEEDDDILGYGRRLLQERFFGDHPYKYSALGSVASLESLSLGDAQKQIQALCLGPNLVLSASGSFDKEKLLDTLQRSFGSIQSASFQPVQLGAPSFKQHTIKETLDREQALVLLAYPDSGIASSAYEVGSMIEEILSGLSSHLFSRVREQKGLAYYVGASRFVGIHTGMFYLYAGTHPSHYQEVLAEMYLEVERLKTGHLTDGEIARAKQHLKSKKRFSLQTPAARAAEATCNILYGKPLNSWRSYDSLIDSISKETIQDFCEKYFQKQLSTELVVLPPQ
jgi:zinc protease